MNLRMNRIMRSAVIAATIVPLGLAQMGGGMMGGSGSSNSGSAMGGGSNNSGSMGGSGNSGSMNGGNGMMGGMSGSSGMGISAPVVGPDGAAYVLRTLGGGSGIADQSLKTELTAISPSTGRAAWSVAIAGTMVSEPALSKDGLSIFLTTSEAGMGMGGSGSGSGMHGNGNSSSGPQQKPALVIVANSLTSARIQNRVEIDADMVSAPRLASDGQTIYVTALATSATAGQSSGAVVRGTLYAFAATGALKFKVDLGQFQMGSMGQ